VSSCILGSGINGASSSGGSLLVDSHIVDIDYTNPHSITVDNDSGWELMDPENNPDYEVPTGSLLHRIQFTSMTLMTWSCSSSVEIYIRVGWRDGDGNVCHELGELTMAANKNQAIFSTKYQVDPFVLNYDSIALVYFIRPTDDYRISISNLRIKTSAQIDSLYPAFSD
jgi:hypothetical protein